MKLNSIAKWSLILGVSVAQVQSYAAEDASVAYKNQRGSVLNLTMHAQSAETGTLSGTFTTAVGNCKTDMNVPVPIVGFYNGNVVALSINFPHCKQVVSMTGNLNADKTALSTLWLDANQVADPVHVGWNANIVGADQYSKI